LKISNSSKLAIRDAIYVALFGVPYHLPEFPSLPELPELPALTSLFSYDSTNASDESEYAARPKLNPRQALGADGLDFKSSQALEAVVDQAGGTDVEALDTRSPFAFDQDKSASVSFDSTATITFDDERQFISSDSVSLEWGESSGNGEAFPEQNRRFGGMESCGEADSSASENGAALPMQAQQASGNEEVAVQDSIVDVDEPQDSRSVAPLFSDDAGTSNGEQDFFLFIKDYDWSLRYRMSRLEGSVLDVKRPMKLEWVRLRRAIQRPEELLEKSSEEIFDWEVREPPSHSGFMYQVTQAVGSGVEAVINFFEGKGLSLLVSPDDGFRLAGRGPSDTRILDENESDEPQSVTHCWVQVMGMPFLPFLQSIVFFNVETVVMDWKA